MRAGTTFGQAEFVGCGNAVDEGTRLVAAGDGADEGTVVGYGRASGQVVHPRPIVEAPVDAAQIARRDQTLQGRVDRRAGPRVGKIGGDLNLIRVGRNVGEQLERRPVSCFDVVMSET